MVTRDKYFNLLYFNPCNYGPNLYFLDEIMIILETCIKTKVINYVLQIMNNLIQLQISYASVVIINYKQIKSLQ